MPNVEAKRKVLGNGQDNYILFQIENLALFASCNPNKNGEICRMTDKAHDNIVRYILDNGLDVKTIKRALRAK